jgi:hypothetical protein
MSKQSILVETRPSEAGSAVDLKLYEVYSTVGCLMDYKYTIIHWYYKDRKEPIGPYELLIEDYDPENGYPKAKANELFTEEEANLLRAYLEVVHRDKPHIVEMELPMNRDLVPFDVLPPYTICKMSANFELKIFAVSDHYELYKEKCYSLPFRVKGCFNWRDYPVRSDKEKSQAGGRIDD